MASKDTSQPHRGPSPKVQPKDSGRADSLHPRVTAGNNALARGKTGWNDPRIRPDNSYKAEWKGTANGPRQTTGPIELAPEEAMGGPSTHNDRYAYTKDRGIPAEKKATNDRGMKAAVRVAGSARGATNRSK